MLQLICEEVRSKAISRTSVSAIIGAAVDQFCDNIYIRRSTGKSARCEMTSKRNKIVTEVKRDIARALPLGTQFCLRLTMHFFHY